MGRRMDFKGLAQAAAKTTVAAAGAAASLAGKGICEGGKLVKQGAEELYRTVDEDRHMLEEIKQINVFCETAMQDFARQSELCERDFDRERKAYDALAEQVNAQIRMYDIVAQYLARQSSQERVGFKAAAPGLNAGPERTGLQASKEACLAGGATGLAFGAGTVGLLTAFGTASTGTALSSLSGAAYLHAMLAALGGGSLATGGFGMVGGAIVLGTAFLAPAAAVTGYLANKRIREAYQEALGRKQKADKLAEESAVFFDEVTLGVATFRRLNQDLSAFSVFFGELLNMSLMACAMKQDAAYQAILQQAAGTLDLFARVRILTADKKPNPQMAAELDDASSAASACRQALYQYTARLSDVQQEAMEGAKREQLHIQNIADMQSQLEQMKLEKKMADTTIREQAKVIQEQKRQLALVSQEFAALREKLRNIADEDARAEMLYADWQEREPAFMAQDQSVFEMQAKRVAGRYAHLDARAVQFVATGEALYEICRRMDVAGMDYSPVVLDYAKSVEYLLTEVLHRQAILAAQQRITLGKAVNVYVRSRAFRNRWKTGFVAVLDEITRCRNTSAHPHGVDKPAADRVRVLILGTTSGTFADGILVYFDELLAGDGCTKNGSGGMQ